MSDSDNNHFLNGSCPCHHALPVLERELSTLRTKLEEAEKDNQAWDRIHNATISEIVDISKDRDQLTAKLADAEQDRDHYKTYEAGQGIFGDFGTAADMRAELNSVRGKLKEAEAGAAAMREELEPLCNNFTQIGLTIAHILASSAAGKVYAERLEKAESELTDQKHNRHHANARALRLESERDYALAALAKLLSVISEVSGGSSNTPEGIVRNLAFELAAAKQERDEAKKRGEELERHIDKIGFYFAGTEHQHIADNALRILRGAAEQDGWLNQLRTELSSNRTQLSSALTLLHAVRKTDFTFEFDRIDGLPWWDARDKVLKGDG